MRIAASVSGAQMRLGNGLVFRSGANITMSPATANGQLGNVGNVFFKAVDWKN
jgi:hypothetical protein